MVKRLMSCIREYKKASILTPLFVSGEVLLEVAIPFLMAALIDKGIEGGNQTAIVQIGALLAVFAVVALCLGILSGKYAAEAAAGFAKNLRRDIYENVQTFSFSNIDKFSAPGIVTRLTTDVTNVQNAYQMIIRIAVRSPLMLFFSLIMTFSINAKLSLIFLAMTPILGIGIYIVFRSAHPIFERVFKTYDTLNTVVQENLLGIRVVKSYVREDFEKQKMQSVSESIYKDFSKSEKLIAFIMPLMQFCVYGSLLLLSWLGAKQIVGGSMTTGQLTSMLSYAMQIMMSLMMFSMVMVMMTMARASAERIVHILDEKSDLSNSPNTVKIVKDGSIAFENVDFSYTNNPKKLALENVNLSIAAGETIGILGGTGSAKTTLVQLIPRLYDATNGTVLVGGLDVKKYEMDVIRNQVAMVLQKNTLFSGTIKDNLRWGNENASDDELIRVCKLAQADDFITSFSDGYDTYIEQGGTNLSGGQKQRICIARALLKKPKILILDDSTSAVDTATDSKIRKAFLEEIPNTTKIIIAQRVSSIEDADKVIVMEDGHIDGFGTPDELMKTNAIFKEISNSQKKGGLS